MDLQAVAAAAMVVETLLVAVMLGILLRMVAELENKHILRPYYSSGNSSTLQSICNICVQHSNEWRCATTIFRCSFQRHSDANNHLRLAQARPGLFQCDLLYLVLLCSPMDGLVKGEILHAHVLLPRAWHNSLIAWRCAVRWCVHAQLP